MLSKATVIINLLCRYVEFGDAVPLQSINDAVPSPLPEVKGLKEGRIRSPHGERLHYGNGNGPLCSSMRSRPKPVQQVPVLGEFSVEPGANHSAELQPLISPYETLMAKVPSRAWRITLLCQIIFHVTSQVRQGRRMRKQTGGFLLVIMIQRYALVADCRKTVWV